MKDKKNSSPNLNEELKQVEKRLLQLIQKRTKLLSKIARHRMEQNKSPIDTYLEKTLWNIWKKHLQGENQRFFRQLFSILNNTSYSKAESKKSSDKPFCLYPKTHPINFSTSAPLSLFQATVSVVLSTISTTETHIEPFPLNDPLVELIKALNQAGGRISWQEDSLHAGPANLTFEGKSFFLGEHETTLYFMLALALTEAGSCKLNASPGLKILNLKPLQDFLPQLGARLTSIEPQSYNLPARLECSGKIPSEITIPSTISPFLGIGLIFTSLLLNKKLKITFANLPKEIVELDYLLQKWGVSIQTEDSTITVSPSELKCPVPFSLEADPLLSAHLLVLPYITSGSVKLEGIWPGYSPRAKFVEKLFQEIGLNFNPSDFTSQHNKALSSQFSFDLEDFKEFFPFVLALAIIQKNKAIIYHQLEDSLLEPGLELLSFLNFNFKTHPEYLEIEYSGEKNKTNKVWTSPSALWTLSYGLISFKFKGICLENPGSITQIWPKFWKIFQSIPFGQVERKIEEQKGEPSRRRIRIG
ncbi:3-phosphoshikimate 1-carboxyvinyltransferase [Desulfonauticus submarinus]|uniref:3-phosphoshikimate 1-carboxyvinyltransferase n=1 Tax=Desulfonauticus submarinus TaxID=206665 RepID=A0A1H0DA64_9BACT|nr:hypothetical protein [Desulfonauticus submarinus]SDN66861.1 3-phosphoshikimate 1-carboxyvinyltransferase [Desulfonauticus submarinus]